MTGFDAKPFGRDKYRQKNLSVDEEGSSSFEDTQPALPLSAGRIAGIARIWVPSFVRYGFHHFRHWSERAILYESETGARFQVLPVAFAIGALIYFSLPREPQLFALLLALGASIGVAIKSYGRHTGNIALIAICLFGGMSAGKVRSNLLDTIMIEKPVQARISGIVLNQEQRANGRRRYTIRITEFDGKSTVVPQIIRASVTAKYPAIDIGGGISGLVRLRPPSGPAYPGGYDFAFQSWFRGIGANGFFLGAPIMKREQIRLSVSFRVGIWVTTFRSRIAARIRQALPGESGNLAVALIVGDRSGISEETADALRRSGLAHILAISGLHMVLVTATIIFLVRGLLALLPGIALYYPIRKWAAVTAMVAVTGYLVISGASIATQRAWIMIIIMLFAILRDRRALTMRNVGLAVLVVLAWRPEAIISPGFQMSFAAVAALIAVYESWGRYRRSKIYRQPQNRWWSWVLRLFKGVTGLGVTSIVAGLATGLFAAYHFYRIAPLGLLANLAAMPIVSLAVMPLALASMVLMPFGLEIYPLALMGLAVEKVVGVAETVSGLGPAGNTGFLPLSSVLLGTLALLIATQLKTGLRLLSLPIIGLAFLLYFDRRPPDILISESGNSIAVRDTSGRLNLLNPRKEKFITTIWKKAFAPGQQAVEKLENNQGKKLKFGSKPYRCDQMGCTIIVREGVVLAWVRRPQAFYEDCQRADIIVTRFTVPDWCTKPGLIIDRDALRAGGAHAISIFENSFSKKIAGIAIKTSYGQIHRPWGRHRNANLTSSAGG